MADYCVFVDTAIAMCGFTEAFLELREFAKAFDYRTDAYSEWIITSMPFERMTRNR